ncbi:MAG: tetratricopeptide repeat protein [Bacteroidales bacterium]|nr:tetratricopeptide repeat protein [Bacteroidales bacterium]
MRKIKKIAYIFLLFIASSITVFSQQKEFNFEIVDSLLQNSSDNSVLPILDEFLQFAQKTNDTVALIKIYDSYARFFEKDTTNDNEKKFLLQKIVYLKKISHYHEDDTSFLYELYKTYNRLALFYESEKEVYTAIDIYYRMLFISQDLSDLKLEANTNRLIGSAYHYLASYNKAISYYEKSLSLARKTGDSSIVFENLFLIGVVYYSSGNYSEAITSLYSALYVAEYLNNSSYKTLSYTEIAKIFFDLGFYEKASEFTNKSLELISINDVNNDIAGNGITYLFCGRNYFEMKDYEKAIECYEKALQIFNYLGNKNFLADVFSGLGQLYTETGEYDLADEYLTKSLLVRKKLGIQADLIDSYVAFGKYFMKLNDNTLAKYYLINAYKLATTLNNLKFIKESSVALYEINKIDGNYQEALLYLEAFKNSSDSIIKQNSFIYVEKIEIEQQYKRYNDEMVQKLEYLNSSKTRLILFIAFLSVALVLIVILSIFFIRKSKIASHQKNLIEKQKQIILKQYERYKMLALVASHTNNSIFIMDVDGKVVWVNDALLNIYQTSYYEIFEINKADFKKLTSFENFDEIFNVCVENLKPYQYVIETFINGKKLWIQTEISPIIEGGVVTNLIGIETEITKIKKAEHEIEKQKKDIEYKNKLMEIYNQELKQQKEAIVTQNEELRQQQEELQAHTDLLKAYNIELQRLSVAASETDNVIYIFDLSGKLLWINNAFTKHTGYTFEDFIEANGDNILRASTFPDIAYYFFVCVEQKKSVRYISEFTTRFGKQIWVQTTLTPILEKDGQVKEIVAVDSDITDVKEAERKISSQNQEIKSSVEYAGRIQKSVLPLPVFVEAIFEKYFIFNKPRDIVSGDFYFVHYFNEKAVLALADSTGHGIPGAFMSLLGTMAFKIVMSKVQLLDPNIILKMLNNEMIKLLHQRGGKDEASDSIDVALCVFDFDKKLVEYAGANIPLYIVRPNEAEDIVVQRIKPSKVTIGYDKLSEPFTVHSFHLNKGDRIYMSSDGFSDQFGGQENKKLKRRSFMDLLRTLYPTPYYQQDEAFEMYLKEWMGPNEQVDDILVIGIEA